MSHTPLACRLGLHHYELAVHFIGIDNGAQGGQRVDVRTCVNCGKSKERSNGTWSMA